MLIPLAIVLPLIAFWLWMFHDMANNDDIPSVVPASLRWPPGTKNQWMIFFVILNIFGASYYYVTVYRERR